MSINKIHVNSSTSMTLNDRFTAFQTTGPKIPNVVANKISQRRRSQNLTKLAEGGAPKASFANRKFLQRLEQKHKIQTALKLKRRSLKSNLPGRQRIQNRIGLKKGAAAKALRLSPSGRLIRSNSLSKIATMKADLVRPALKRSNSTSSIASRLGNRRRTRGGGGAGGSQLPRRQLKRSASKQRVARSRSRSVSNLRRANSRTNLRRTNSKGNLNLNRGREAAPPQKRINRNAPLRSASRTRKRSSSVNGRLSRPNTNLARRRLSHNGVNNGVRGAAQQGRAPFRRRNSTGGNALNRSGARQGRISRPRGRGNTLQQQRGRSRSRSRINNQSVQSRRGGGAGGNINRRGNNQRGRGSGRSSRVRGGRGAPKPELKKEDLDKELDQYMANTKTALEEMDVYMGGN